MSLRSLATFAWWGTGGEIKPYKHTRLICHYLERLMDDSDPMNRLIVTVPPQHGKGLTHVTEVLTPGGFKEHGDLVPGDMVYSPSGEQIEVIAIGPEEIYDVRMHFSDGGYADCHENHEWPLTRRTERRGLAREAKWYEAREKLTEGSVPIGSRGGRWSYQLPLVSPLDCSDIDLPIDPYALGAWLGDGTSSSGTLTFQNSDRVVYESIVGHDDFDRLSESIHPSTGVHRATVGGLRTKLRVSGLLNNKHIPDIYFSASLGQRLELLAGLIDTDGSRQQCKSRGDLRRFTISTCMPKLCESIVTLVKTFGWKAGVYVAEPCLSTSGIQGNRHVYNISFSPDIYIPCRLERKRPVDLNVKRRRVALTGVERVEPKPGRCIQVEGGLYLATRNLYPTHNSTLCSRVFPVWHLGHKPSLPCAITTYGQDLSNDHGAYTKNLMESAGSQLFGRRLSYDSKSKAYWRLENYPEGYLKSVGRGGGLTGKPIKGVLVCDDLLKNYEEALSPTTRESAWSWYKTVANTRLGKDAKICHLATRWHQEDVIGKILANDAGRDRWTVLSLPAIAEEDEYWPEAMGGGLFRAAGEALCPELHPLEQLEETRDLMDPFEWSCLYQQKPIQPTGCYWDAKLFDDSVVDHFPEKLKYLCVAIDPSMGKQSKVNDYQAIVALGVPSHADNHIYVAAHLIKANPHKLVDACLTWCRSHLPRDPDCIGIEQDQFQELFVEPMVKTMRERGFYNTFPAGISHEGVPKAIRIRRLDNCVNKKIFRYVRSEGTMKLIEQMKIYPPVHRTDHDDGPDALEQCQRLLRELDYSNQTVSAGRQ